MPISDLWKVVKHRDNTIYLSYRTLMRTENLDNVATTKGKRKCSLWNEQLSCSDWVILYDIIKVFEHWKKHTSKNNLQK